MIRTGELLAIRERHAESSREKKGPGCEQTRLVLVCDFGIALVDTLNARNSGKYSESKNHKIKTTPISRISRVASMKKQHVEKFEVEKIPFETR